MSTERASGEKNTKRHDEVQLVRILEREFEWYNKRAVYKGKDCALSKDVGDFSRSLCNMRFADGFECVDTLCVLLPNLHHLAEATFANYFKKIKRIDCEALVAGRFEIYFEVERTRACGGTVPLVRGMLKDV
jgi:hypothetical protein